MTEVRLVRDAHRPSQLTDRVTPATYLLRVYLSRTTVIGWTWLGIRALRPIDRARKETLQTKLHQQDQVITYLDLLSK